MKRIINQIIAKAVQTALLVAIPAMVLSQTASDGSMPQYYFEDFVSGTVKMKNGQIQTPLLNYNTVTERIVFVRDDNYYDLTNPEMVDTVTIQNIRFVPVGKVFYEVLLSGPTALFIQHKGSLLPAGKQVGYGGTSQLASAHYLSNIDLSSGRYNLPLPSDYIVNVTPIYWIRRDNELLSFINERQFMNLYPGKTDKIKAFTRENRIKFDRKEHLVRVVEFCNSLE
jgi:hypothetical protein